MEKPGIPWASWASSPNVSTGLLPPRATARPSSTSMSVSGDAESAGRERDHLPLHAFARDHCRIAGIDRLPACECTDALADGIGVARPS